MRLTNIGFLGIGTNAPDKQVEINSTTGDCLRLTNNDPNGTAANYADITVSLDGKLILNSSENCIDQGVHFFDGFSVFWRLL